MPFGDSVCTCVVGGISCIRLAVPVKAPTYAPPPAPPLSWAGHVGILEGVASHRANLDPNCTTNIGCDTRGLAAQSARCLATIGSRVISSTASKATGLGSAVSRPAWAMPKFRSPSTSDGLAPFAVEPGSPSTRHLSTSPVVLPLAAWITTSSRTLTTADWSATFLDDKMDGWSGCRTHVCTALDPARRVALCRLGHAHCAVHERQQRLHRRTRRFR
jgi:hypothetical protein